MDDYFIKNIKWGTCTNPINAIDFSAQLATLEKLEAILELLGLTLYEDIEETLSNTQDDYLTLDIKGTCVVYNEFFINKKEEITPLLD